MTDGWKRLDCFAWLAAAAILIAALVAPVGAYVERMYSLEEVFSESTNICFGKIVSVDQEKKQIVAVLERDLKGKCAYEKVQINTSTSLPQFVPYMMAKVKPGQPIIMFYKAEGRSLACLTYMDNFWFQLYGTDMDDHSQMWWRMSHIEIRMNRTWNKSLNELHNIIQQCVAGSMTPPPPDPNVRPFEVKDELEKLGGGSAVGQIFGRYVTLPRGAGEARGVAWVDYDGDGDRDAYCCSPEGNRMYRAEPGGIFFETTGEIGLKGGSASAAWADYNNDGRPDLLLPSLHLFTNTGGKFRDDTALLPKLAGGAATCIWIDYDGDGWVDILAPAGDQGIAVFKNTGKDDERFKDVSAEAGLGPNGGAAGGCFISVADIDGDGFSDFLCNTEKGMLFRNTGEGKFEPVKDSGLQFAAGDAGVAWGDYDNDGDTDLFVPQDGAGKLFANNNDGTFSDVTAKAGDLAEAKGQWTSARWGDLDRDGFLDLYVGGAEGGARLFVNNGNRTFRDKSDELGLARVAGNAKVVGSTLADYDGDGDLDILANSSDGLCTVLLNDFDGGGAKRSFLVVQPKNAKGLVGATVRLFDEKDKLIGLRELGVAQSAGAQTDIVAFFGVPGGKYKVTVCMSDGGFGEQAVEINGEGKKIEMATE